MEQLILTTKIKLEFLIPDLQVYFLLKNIPTIHAKYAESSVTTIHVNSEDMVKSLNQLNHHETSGPDNISVRFLKQT